MLLRRVISGRLVELFHVGRSGVRRRAHRVGHLGWWLAHRGRIPAGCVWTEHDGRRLAATPVSSFSSTSAIEAVLAAAHDALTSAAVPHDVRRPLGLPPQLRLDSGFLDDAYGALRDARHTSPLYVLAGTRVLPPGRWPPSLRPGSPATIFAAWASHSGSFVAGPDAGITVIVTPSRRVTVTEPPPLPAPEPVPVIDAVYTWVDGTDDAWRTRREAGLRERAGPGALHDQASNPARYDPIDELRYSLRSIQAYAPWIRHIYLVTDQQRPRWLADHPRLTVVDHREIFRVGDALPTFNSHAIETQLHHIDGLAEHYLYLNDDVFLGRSVSPSLFFDAQGRPRVFVAADVVDPGPPGEDDPPVVQAAKNNREVLLRLTGHHVTHKLKHVPHPHVRSVVEELEERAQDAFARTARSRLRSRFDISVASSLAPHYALATGRASQGDIRHFYADVGSPELRWRLGPLLERHDADAICLNATAVPPTSEEHRVSGFLERYFPLPSAFET